ncbi:hypothetical protein ELH83_11505 [Rhizobium leguminosarum]|nr:hypothetical protein ELH83_11505 [Rhizobium leguminosarum]
MQAVLHACQARAATHVASLTKLLHCGPLAKPRPHAHHVIGCLNNPALSKNTDSRPQSRSPATAQRDDWLVDFGGFGLASSRQCGSLSGSRHGWLLALGRRATLLARFLTAKDFAKAPRRFASPAFASSAAHSAKKCLRIGASIPRPLPEHHYRCATLSSTLSAS